MSISICVYCGSSENVDPIYFKAAEDFGKMLAQLGHTIIFGGGTSGLMFRISKSALDHGGKVIGVISHYLADIQGLPDKLTHIYMVDSMHRRKQKFFDLSDIFCVLPGGFGTLDEFFEILMWKQIRYHDRPIIIINNYWDPLIQLFKHMEETKFTNYQNSPIYHVLNNLDELDTFIARYKEE